MHNVNCNIEYNIKMLILYTLLHNTAGLSLLGFRLGLKLLL